MNRPEEAIQRSIVQYLRITLPADQYRVAAIPNAARRSVVEGRSMRATGTLAGMPDLIIIGPCGRCWFIEVKSETGRLSPDQKSMREWRALIDVPHVVARGIDDLRAALAKWRLLTREAT